MVILVEKDFKMKFRKIYAVPFTLLAIMVTYLMVFNTVHYFDVIFIFYTSSILFRNKLLSFFEKDRFVLFIVAEFLLVVFTASTCLAMLLWDEDKLPVILITNGIVLLFEIGYSLKEYPYRFKIKSSS